MAGWFDYFRRQLGWWSVGEPVEVRMYAPRIDAMLVVEMETTERVLTQEIAQNVSQAEITA